MDVGNAKIITSFLDLLIIYLFHRSLVQRCPRNIQLSEKQRLDMNLLEVTNSPTTKLTSKLMNAA